VTLLVVAIALGAHLTYDPFAKLPDDESVRVNLAGVLPAEGEEPLEKPLGIAMDGNRVFVADSGAGAIRIFNRYGRDRGAIVLADPSGAGSAPAALALTGDGRLAVVDGALGTVVVVKARADEKAEALFELGAAGDEDTAVRAISVAYDDGEFYVVGASGMRVMVYDDSGAFVREFGAEADDAQAHPGGLVVADGIVHVSDTKSGRVVMFDADSGEVVGEWPDAYSVPRGMVEVARGFALVDVLGQAAYVCDAEGARTHIVNAQTVPGAPLILPEQVAWDSLTSRLYITDSAGGSVVVLNVREP